MKDTIVAGDTLDFETRVPDYPPSAGYTLKYRLIPRTSGSAIELTAAPTADDAYRVMMTPAETATWAAGEYSCAAWVEQTGVSITVDPQLVNESGSTSLLVRILPDFRTVAAYDGRSPARKALDAINAGLATYSEKAHVAEYEIAGRRMKFANQGDLLVMRDRLKAEVWNEDEAARLASGLPSRRRIGIRFARA
jgi:hypothetical protein